MNIGHTLTLDSRDDAGPKYEQIRRHLVAQMQSGKYVPTKPLPGQRDLAVSMGISVGTLRRALIGLEREGFIRQVHGKGTFVNSLQEQREVVANKTFSVILPSVSELPYPTLIEGLQQMAVDIGHQILVGSSSNEASKQEKLIRLAVEQRVAGMVIVPATHPIPKDQVRFLEGSQIPVVVCHRAMPGLNAPLVTWSFKDVAHQMANVLASHGHHRVVSLLNVRSEFTVQFVEHFRTELKNHGSEGSDYQVHYHGEIEDGEKLRHAVHDTLKQILRDKDRPTAIHCLNVQDAELVYVLAGEFGLKIPEDLSLMTFGDAHPKSVIARRITTVARDEHKIGQEAGNLLSKMFSFGASSQNNRAIEVPLVLLPGETAGAAPVT